MNLLARAERTLLVRALVAFALIVAILILGLASAKAEPGCNRYNADGSCGPAVSVKSVPYKKGKRHVAPIYFSGSLVDRARRYMGTNPTGWSSLWCGRFMAMIAPNAAARVRNPNMARDWATLPRVSAQVGAIVVLSRGRSGGHVGVVTSIDANGNPTVVSGNHGGKVGEGVYPKGRVLAYVMP